MSPGQEQNHMGCRKSLPLRLEPCKRAHGLSGQKVAEETVYRKASSVSGSRPELTAGRNAHCAAWQSQGHVATALCCFNGIVQVMHPLLLFQLSAVRRGREGREG